MFLEAVTVEYWGSDLPLLLFLILFQTAILSCHVVTSFQSKLLH